MEGIFQQFMDAESHIAITDTDRITRTRNNPIVNARSISCEDAIASFVTTTQVDSIRTLLSQRQAASGFLNRIIFPSGKSKKKDMFGYAPDQLAGIQELISIHNWTEKKHELHFSEDGLDLLREFFDDKVIPTMRQNRSDTLARLDLNLVKLCTILAINEKNSVISAEIVDKVRYMFPYLLKAYEILIKRVGISDLQEVINELKRHIERLSKPGKTPPSRTDLDKRIKHKNWDDKMINEALDLLVRSEYIMAIEGTNKFGRKTTRYQAIA